MEHLPWRSKQTEVFMGGDEGYRSMLLRRLLVRVKVNFSRT